MELIRGVFSLFIDSEYSNFTKYFWIYRVITSFIALIMCTLFLFIEKWRDIENDLIPSADARTKLVLNYFFGYFLFIICWIMLVFYIILAKIVYGLIEEGSLERSLDDIGRFCVCGCVWVELVLCL